jgi:hypothetical protein
MKILHTSSGSYTILMVICVIQVVVYLIRSMVPACVRGRRVEMSRQPCQISEYSLNSKLETPSTVADDVKPQPRWHGANEEDILAIIRMQRNKSKL